MNWKDLIPAVLALWALIVLCAAVAMVPTVRSTPLSWDDQIFEPGGMMLLESLRLHRADFFKGVRLSLLIFALSNLLLLLARARLTASIVDVVEGRAPRQKTLAHVPAYVGVSFIKVLGLGFGVVLFTLALRTFPPFEGTLAPQLLVLYGLMGIWTLLALGFWNIFADTCRLALFHEISNRARFRAAVTTLRRHALSLIATRAIWTAFGLGGGYLTLVLASHPLKNGSTGAVATFLLSQTLVLLNLGLEAWWLSEAARKLALYSATEWAEAAPR